MSITLGLFTTCLLLPLSSSCCLTYITRFLDKEGLWGQHPSYSSHLLFLSLTISSPGTIADVAESSEHEILYCLMYMYHTICLFFTTHYAYGSLAEGREEEQKAASQTAGSEAPDGNSVMLWWHGSRRASSSTHCISNYSDRTQQSFEWVMQIEFHGQGGIKFWIQSTDITDWDTTACVCK